MQRAQRTLLSQSRLRMRRPVLDSIRPWIFCRFSGRQASQSHILQNLWFSRRVRQRLHRKYVVVRSCTYCIGIGLNFLMRRRTALLFAINGRTTMQRSTIARILVVLACIALLVTNQVYPQFLTALSTVQVDNFSVVVFAILALSVLQPYITNAYN